jgi:hypothetical protein
VDLFVWRTRILAVGIGLAYALMFCGCAGISANRLTLLGPNTLPDQCTLVCGQLVIHGDVPLAEYRRLFDELTAQRDEIFRRLGLSSSRKLIDVYLFDGEERFEEFMRLHHPEFPNRRAFFLETDARFTVYAQLGDRMADDLRHEVSHAYLHSVVPEIPLWLDEGLAKYFEVPRKKHGLNRPLLDRFQHLAQNGHWQPNLRRLEKFSSTYNMTQDDYVEAWAWVHFLLEAEPAYEDLLRDYLARFQVSHHDALSSISQRLAAVVDQPEAVLTTHLGELTISLR